MAEFTTVLWDMDDTLLDFPYSQEMALRQCFRSVGMELTDEMHKRYAEINDSFWKKLELGLVTKKQLLTGRFTTLFEEFGLEFDVKPFLAEYQVALGVYFSYIDNSIDICRGMQGKVKQYIVTNGVASTQRSKLSRSGLSDLMEGLFISEEVGVNKPHIDFFRYCLEHVEEKDVSKILLVGDSLTSDIKGGAMAGIPTCWYNRKGKEFTGEYKPDYEIKCLDELPGILGI